ncbi:MAG TPA: hypothetical protein VGL62_15055 [Vicinamibacterales bacterium]|jgi:hypothetical protein
MPLMNIFEPLFLLLALVTGVTVIAALLCAVFGASRRALRLLRRLAIGAAVYFAIVIIASLVVTPRQFTLHELRCFDDWCITVSGAQRHPSPPVAGSNFVVSLRLTNRARRVPMDEKDTVAYVVDAQAHRYDSLPDATAFPFDGILQPGESVTTFRYFNIPDDGRKLGLVFTHEGGFPIGWLIISEGGWFQKPAGRVAELTPWAEPGSRRRRSTAAEIAVTPKPIGKGSVNVIVALNSGF